MHIPYKDGDIVLITVEELTVRYKNVLAVDRISFSVAEGEIFGIIGPNGAGKTSTIECIEGLRRPAGGEIRVLGIDPVQRRQLYQHIGVQLQETYYPPAIKVEELCRLFSSFYSTPLPYRELLRRFGLEGKGKARIYDLSGGQRRKVSIILALLGNPQILFLDELTTGLDPQSRKDMWELIKTLRQEGKTIFMTTHYMEEAEYLCDRICMLVQGKIAALGTVNELVDQAGPGQVITFNTVSDVGGLRQVPGVKRVVVEGNRVQVFGHGPDLLKDVVVWLTGNQVDFDDLSETKSNLEDVFLKYTGTGLEEAQ
jgi:ABC-2 type transport system ATP-binding protein